MKKIVFLPYDMDTAIGINNEGALVFSYNLEDIDTLESGADIFNGQQSVLWKNVRAAFYDEIKTMYQGLRSTGALSYAKVEQMFEEHQGKWPEAIFNEDAFFKYLEPLIQDGTGSYLSMLQGSKAEQRKWWLYNRFRYLDSKYNAGDALTDVIQLRGYAKDNITVIPYADIYPAVKYGSYLVTARGARTTPTTLVCPLDNVNDTEIYIYSASQLASVGDLSGFMVGFADFSMATKLQHLKIGDSSADYSNGNLTELTLGNNTLLKTLDVRNCPNLGTEEQKAVDISGCTNIEEVYLGGTAISGCTLPNGGVLKTLQLPGTITNLTIRNQPALATLEMPSYANITTLRLENLGETVNTYEILRQVAANTRVRVLGFTWEAENSDAIFAFLDFLDTMRGLDENGNNLDKAQVRGTIHVENILGSELATIHERYPDITVEAQHITSNLFYYTYDGATLLYTEPIVDGGNGGAYTGKPSRPSTAANTFSFIGWSKKPNSTTVDADALTNVTADRKVYAAYSITGRTYTVYFYNGNSLLQTVPNVPYGGNATYTGATPVSPDGSADEYPFEGWSPAPTNIQGNTSCYAQYGSPREVAEIEDSWEEILAAVANGTAARRYKIGNYKPLDLGAQGIVNMQIAAKNKDALADGSGTAALSWISLELLSTSHRMNPDLVTNYVYPEVASWTASGNTWTTQNRYNVSDAKATWKITATEDGTLSISYKTSNGTASRNKISITVNGETVATDFTGTTASTYNVEVSAGDMVTVEAVYSLLSASYSYYGTVTFSGTGAFTTDAVIETAPNRKVDSYEEATGSIGGWEKTEMRAYLKDTVKPLIPELVRNAIKDVIKTQPAYDTAAKSFTQTTTEDVWIPSYAECFGTSSMYKGLFENTNANRIKKKVGATSASAWWLRSANYHSGFYIVGSGGNYNYTSAYYSYGVALGFCT